jgi:hypothetical protein
VCALPNSHGWPKVSFRLADYTDYNQQRTIIQKLNPQLFHKAWLRCAKAVQNIFFLRLKSVPTVTFIKWKKNFVNLR